MAKATTPSGDKPAVHGPVRGAFAQPDQEEREEWLARANAPLPTGDIDDDPWSARYVRNDIDETPGTILHYWLGYAADRPSLLKERNGLWFGASYETDRTIANRFGDILARLASGEARRWAERGPRERLAAVIALDQFSRNMFRGTPAAFENDALALSLAQEGVARGEDDRLKPIERWFLYMPFEHSEAAADQKVSVAKFARLAAEASPETREILESTHDYAKRHAAVIERFGRFPHRNDILGRPSTEAEIAFLKTPGSRF
jgi:uncharacterized protein (DUF924 family)